MNDEGRPKVRRYSTPRQHPSYTVEPCPACGFPEADGGYCSDCGWTQYDPALEVWASRRRSRRTRK